MKMARSVIVAVEDGILVNEVDDLAVWQGNDVEVGKPGLVIERLRQTHHVTQTGQRVNREDFGPKWLSRRTKVNRDLHFGLLLR